MMTAGNDNDRGNSPDNCEMLIDNFMDDNIDSND